MIQYAQSKVFKPLRGGLIELSAGLDGIIKAGRIRQKGQIQLTQDPDVFHRV